jgi:imidazolonepropionase-like amidohydrolase
VLRAAHLIDGTGGPAIQDGVVVVNGNTITAVGRWGSVSVPANASVVELGDATLLPGFIDAHVHLIGRTLGDPRHDDAAVRDYDAMGAILGVPNAAQTLLAGFTSVRNVGAPAFQDMALRQAINEGKVPGPRMEAAGQPLGITGGHCDENGFRPGLLDKDRPAVANGTDAVRAAVRYDIKYGADVIKICATGGVLSEGDAVGATQYNLDEMQAIVAEANKLDRKVAAHAHGTEGIKLAIQAGVSSIEHGSFLDAEGAKMMADRGTYLVPTLMAGEAVEKFAKNGVLTGLRAQKALAAAAAMRNSIRLARQYHVPIALGTDAGVIPHGTNAHEFVLLKDWGGYTPMEAIVAGTSSAARLLGWDKNVGTLTAGKWADVVAVPGDPLQDLTVMEKTSFVMKDGKVYKGPGGPKPKA